MKIDWLEGLRKMSGHYAGGGKNHEGENFASAFCLEPCDGENGFSFSYRALVGEVVVHDEKSLLARDEAGRISVFALTSNTPAVLKHAFEESASRVAGDDWTMVFQYGEIENRTAFRERLTLRFHVGRRQLGYDYAWGMPGKDFGNRSSSEMKRV